MHKDTNAVYKREVILSFNPNISLGSWLTHFLNPGDYYGILDKNLYEMVIKVAAQDNNPIDLIGEKCLCTL